MLEAGAWAGFAALSLLLGAFLALNVGVSRRHVGEAMGFGAGALIAALAYDLIPNKNSPTSKCGCRSVSGPSCSTASTR
jgi:hypothetical protein